MVQRRLIVVPDVPLAQDALERAVAHRRAEQLVDAIAQRRVGRRQNADVVADLHARRLDGEPPDFLQHALRQDVVEQHGVHAADHQIG